MTFLGLSDLGYASAGPLVTLRTPSASPLHMARTGLDRKLWSADEEKNEGGGQKGRFAFRFDMYYLCTAEM